MLHLYIRETVNNVVELVVLSMRKAGKPQQHKELLLELYEQLI